MIFSQMFDMLDVGVLILDKDLKVFKWNRWMATHSKIPPEEIVGRPLFDFFSNLNQPWFLRNCKSVFTFGNFAFFSQKLHKYCFPFKAYNTMGTGFEYMQQSCTVGPLRDNNNHISYIYITVQDVTDVAAYEQKLITMNTKDGLTGIYNRRYLETKLAEEFDRHIRYTRPLSLILIDIDHFKKINDTHGHQAGDLILKNLATLIDNRIRTIDIVARYGGEEFCCLLPETTSDSALALAEFLRMGVEAEIFHFRDKALRITISLGVSELNETVDSAETLIKIADDGLYEAKRSGRNRVSMISDRGKGTCC